MWSLKKNQSHLEFFLVFLPRPAILFRNDFQMILLSRFNARRSFDGAITANKPCQSGRAVIQLTATTNQRYLPPCSKSTPEKN